MSDIPVGGSIKRQSQQTKPVTSDNTIMDDPVVLMDDNALMGGLTVTYSATRGKIEPLVPRSIIRIKR